MLTSYIERNEFIHHLFNSYILISLCILKKDKTLFKCKIDTIIQSLDIIKWYIQKTRKIKHVILYTYILLNLEFSSYSLITMAKVAELPVGIKTLARYETGEWKNCELCLVLILQNSLFDDSTIMVIDTIVMKRQIT